jgi:hypothetical protein
MLRFNILSEFVANRLTPREISPLLEVIGIRNAGQIVGNTIVIHPDLDLYRIPDPSFCSEIPQVAPPKNLLRITELEIKEFIGNELLQFLNVSRRLFVGCWLTFRGNFYIIISFFHYNYLKISTISRAFIQCNSFRHFSDFSIEMSQFNFGMYRKKLLIYSEIQKYFAAPN